MNQTEEYLIGLMRGVCEELGLPEEKGEHCPILEALNQAHNRGATRTPPRVQVIANSEGRPEPHPVCIACSRLLFPSDTQCPYCSKIQPTCEVVK